MNPSLQPTARSHKLIISAAGRIDKQPFSCHWSEVSVPAFRAWNVHGDHHNVTIKG